MKTQWGEGAGGCPGGAVTVSDPRVVPAIELLKKEKPGAFVVRDSTSYRGSFGLALKVQEVPAPAQNRSGTCCLCLRSRPLRHWGVVGPSPGRASSLQDDLEPGPQRLLGGGSTSTLSRLPSNSKALCKAPVTVRLSCMRLPKSQNYLLHCHGGERRRKVPAPYQDALFWVPTSLQARFIVRKPKGKTCGCASLSRVG